MSRMDYCFWSDEKCWYSDDEKYCTFHRAMEAGDVQGMIAALSGNDQGRLPEHVEIVSAQQVEGSPGTWEFVIRAYPKAPYDA